MLYPRLRLQPVPALGDNYIWLMDDGASAVVVDPGAADGVERILRDEGLDLVAVLLTHHHADHIGAAPELLRGWPHAKIYGPKDERIALVMSRVGEGDEVRVDAPSLAFRVIGIPGHTSSHIAFSGMGFVFCGDTLFSLGCGRMFEGTPAQFHHSLTRLASLPDSALVCCGHEYTVANGDFAITVDPANEDLQARIEDARLQRSSGNATLPSTIGSERACNPFLRVGTEAVTHSLTSRAGASPRDDIEAFAWLRSWKDSFRSGC